MPYAFGAAAGGGALPQITINKSQTWVPPQDGNVCIHVIGAGGSGSVAVSQYGGGGAGAYAKIPSLAVTTAGSFTLVVGVGGAFRDGVNGEQTGVAGGNSTIAGTGITGTLTCGGGGGGRYDMYNSSVGWNAVGGVVSGSTNEGWAGFAGGTGKLGGGAVGVYATGVGETADTRNWGNSSDVAGTGGIAMSGYGTICGGARGGAYNSNNSYLRTQEIHGDDLCGGGYAYSSVNDNVASGDGGIGGGGGGARSPGYLVHLHSGRGGHGLILIQYLS